jgi:hypothetical protein
MSAVESFAKKRVVFDGSRVPCVDGPRRGVYDWRIVDHPRAACPQSAWPGTAEMCDLTATFQR